MSTDLFDLPECECPPPDECCKCAQSPVVISVRVGDCDYAFCAAHDMRGIFLQRGKAQYWPALRIPGQYAIDSDREAWMLTAICGTDERVFALLEALDESEERLVKTI